MPSLRALRQQNLFFRLSLSRAVRSARCRTMLSGRESFFRCYFARARIHTQMLSTLLFSEDDNLAEEQNKKINAKQRALSSPNTMGKRAPNAKCTSDEYSEPSNTLLFGAFTSDPCEIRMRRRANDAQPENERKTLAPRVTRRRR